MMRRHRRWDDCPSCPNGCGQRAVVETGHDHALFSLVAGWSFKLQSLSWSGSFSIE